jgi:hypothetical protein
MRSEPPAEVPAALRPIWCSGAPVLGLKAGWFQVHEVTGTGVPLKSVPASVQPGWVQLKPPLLAGGAVLVSSK